MELFRALGVLAEPPSKETPRLAHALDLGALPGTGDYEELFLFQLYPFASVYLGAEGKLGGEARDRIAGFWRALDLEPGAEPDHLALMLGLYSRLAELEGDSRDERSSAGWRHVRQAWFWEHLASWLPVYLIRVRDIGGPFYSRWAEILLGALADEATELGLPDTVPLHHRQAPALEDPRSSGEGSHLLDQLLTPIRSGFVLVASDLRRAAEATGLGLRAGERRFALEGLLGQAAPATLDWLSDHAASSARRYEAIDEELQPAVTFWRSRAAVAADLLAELAGEARRVDSSGSGA